MAKTKERELALKLRISGHSIGDIADILSVSKGTVSHWCKDISLSTEAIERIAKRSKAKSTASLLKYSELKRTDRIRSTQASLEVGAKKVGTISPRDIYCIGLGLYWGEGYKKGSQEFGFTNSDAGMIRFYIHWLEVVFGVTRMDLILRVSINAMHTDRLAEVQAYWSKVTGVDQSQFTKMSFIQTAHKKQYSDEVRHYGTLRVKVRRGTQFRREVLGAINAVGEKRYKF